MAAVLSARLVVNLPTYAGIATALGSPFSNRVGIVPKQRAQQVRSYDAQVAHEFNVKLITSHGEKNMKMPSHKYILQEALKAKIEIPYDQTCQSGRCEACIAKLVKGQVKHDEQFALKPDDLKKNFVVLCRALPMSDVVIDTNIDKKELYRRPPGPV